MKTKPLFYILRSWGFFLSFRVTYMCTVYPTLPGNYYQLLLTKYLHFQLIEYIDLHGKTVDLYGTYIIDLHENIVHLEVC